MKFWKQNISWGLDFTGQTRLALSVVKGNHKQIAYTEFHRGHHRVPQSMITA
jgi:hypothetical protein